MYISIYFSKLTKSLIFFGVAIKRKDYRRPLPKNQGHHGLRDSGVVKLQQKGAMLKHRIGRHRLETHGGSQDRLVCV